MTKPAERRPARILVTGACGQLGTELVPALQASYGKDAVITADVRAGSDLYLDVTDAPSLRLVLVSHGITQVYHLAALLPATSELNPLRAWNLNMTGLLNILEGAREYRLDKVFWPSSNEVFGLNSKRVVRPQNSVTEPTTMYGICKSAGEQLCRYYHQTYGLDVRSLRYPGLISYQGLPGGETTDYAVAIFHQALAQGSYTCFLKESTMLPMLYMPDAIRATLELMQVSVERLTIRTAYNLCGMSFSPGQLAEEITRHIPEFTMRYEPDFRHTIADSWPCSIDDRQARKDWGWAPEYDLRRMATDMIRQLKVVRDKSTRAKALV